jgi:hypothetical protein
MMISNFDVMRVAFTPAKAYAPLIVDPNAVLSHSIPRQLLQSVAGWATEIVEGFGGIQDQELPQRSSLQLTGPPPHELP